MFYKYTCCSCICLVCFSGDLKLEDRCLALLETFVTNLVDILDVECRSFNANHIFFEGELIDYTLIRHAITEEMCRRNLFRAINMNVEVSFRVLILLCIYLHVCVPTIDLYIQFH